MAELANKDSGTLTGYNCKDCLNRGYFHRVNDKGQRYTEECPCMAKRRTIKRIKKSGLEELLSLYTLDNWKCNQKWQIDMKKSAIDYSKNPNGWFFLSGTPGTGKTHICTALCTLLMDAGMEVRYCLWRSFSVQAKSLVNKEDEYKRLVTPLKRVKVLYIDDLFKTGKGASPTEGDVNLAFEILNERYNNSGLLTILSSELTVGNILEIDEGVGSRIYQKSKNHYADLTGKENFRLKG